MLKSLTKYINYLINPFKLYHILKIKINYYVYKNKLGHVGSGTIIYSKIWINDPKNIFIGKKCLIGPFCRIESFTRYGTQLLKPKLQIGDFCSLQHGVHIYCANSVKIGNGVLIASGCLITDNDHGTNPEGEFYLKQPLKFKATFIDDGVWLGENVCILKGAIIGKRSIIGSNSVVSNEIPPFSIAIGNPARVIKQFNFNTKRWEKV